MKLFPFILNGALCIAILILAGFGVKAFNQKDFERLVLLTGGRWVTQRTTGQIIESWKRSGASQFSGVSYQVSRKDTVFLETVRLFISGTDIVYAPTTYGQNQEQEVHFKLKSISRGRYVFENLAHDFPQRIVYDFKSEDSLHAYIEGSIESKPKHIDYFYRRQQP